MYVPAPVGSLFEANLFADVNLNGAVHFCILLVYFLMYFLLYTLPMWGTCSECCVNGRC